ncbi:MAG: hypothetical protein D6814_09280 [Calditrichaeota bacterium]|nr:MAG: hypothetical protein D6814_09280 [Calditrichota bacterium]
MEGSNRDGLQPRSLFEAQFLERTGFPVGVRDEKNPAQQPPANFTLEQNYPNPFNPQTVIRYQLPARSDVQMILYSATGRAVRHLVIGRMPAGYHSVVWDAMDDSGQRVASGVYLYVLRAQSLSGQNSRGFVARKKLILLK